MAIYTRNRNTKSKLKITEKWITIASPDGLFNHGIDVEAEQMGCEKLISI